MEVIEVEGEAVEGQTMESLPEGLLNPISSVGIVYKSDTYERHAPSKSRKIKGKRKGRQPGTAEPGAGCADQCLVRIEGSRAS